MFSRSKSERFVKDNASAPGPGSYEIPKTFEDPAQEGSVGSFQVYEDFPEKSVAKQQAPQTPRRKLFGAAKENRLPVARNNAMSPGAGAGPRPGGLMTTPHRGSSTALHGCGASDTKGSTSNLLEVDQLKRRLLTDEKLKAGDFAVARKSAVNAHQQLLARDRQVEDLQRKVDELSNARTEALKQAASLEADRVMKRKALQDKDQTIAALQRSLQHAKAQLEDRCRERAGSDLDDCQRRLEDKVRELASARELVAHQAERLAEQEAQLQESARELEATHVHLDGLEQRLAAQTSATEARLQELTDSQERIQRSVQERDLKVSHWVRELDRELWECQDRELQLTSQVLVRQASLAAALGLTGQAEEARLAAEGQAQRLTGEVEAMRADCHEAARRTTQAEEAGCRSSCDLAELRGRFFTSEQARSLGEQRQRQLEEALAAKGAEAAELSEGQGGLRRELEELRAARLEAEACSEAQAAQLQAQAMELQDLRREVELLRRAPGAREGQALEAAADPAGPAEHPDGPAPCSPTAAGQLEEVPSREVWA